MKGFPPTARFVEAGNGLFARVDMRGRPWPGAMDAMPRRRGARDANGYEPLETRPGGVNAASAPGGMFSPGGSGNWGPGGGDDAEPLHDNPKIHAILRAMMDMNPEEQDELIEAIHGQRAESMAGDQPPDFPGSPHPGGRITPPRPGVNELARGAMDSARYERDQAAFFDAFPDARRIVNRRWR
jgi:hypothetical protein